MIKTDSIIHIVFSFLRIERTGVPCLRFAFKRKEQRSGDVPIAEHGGRLPGVNH